MRASTLLLSLLAACGADEVGAMRVELRLHELACNDIAGLQAELQVAGRSASCPLDIGANRSASGVCPSVPTGRPVQIRLVYFTQLDPETRVTLAVANQDLDLTAPSDEVVSVSFPASSVEWSDLDQFDDDADQMSNLAEVCAGRDPRAAGV